MSVKLESSDEQVFEVAREIAEMSVTVKHMLDDVDADSDAPIPLPNVTSKILAKVCFGDETAFYAVCVFFLT